MKSNDKPPSSPPKNSNKPKQQQNDKQNSTEASKTDKIPVRKSSSDRSIIKMDSDLDLTPKSSSKSSQKVITSTSNPAPKPSIASTAPAKPSAVPDPPPKPSAVSSAPPKLKPTTSGPPRPKSPQSSMSTASSTSSLSSIRSVPARPVVKPKSEPSGFFGAIKSLFGGSNSSKAPSKSPTTVKPKASPPAVSAPRSPQFAKPSSPSSSSRSSSSPGIPTVKSTIKTVASQPIAIPKPTLKVPSTPPSSSPPRPPPPKSSPPFKVPAKAATPTKIVPPARPPVPSSSPALTSKLPSTIKTNEPIRLNTDRSNSLPRSQSTPPTTSPPKPHFEKKPMYPDHEKRKKEFENLLQEPHRSQARSAPSQPLEKQYKSMGFRSPKSHGKTPSGIDLADLTASPRAGNLYESFGLEQQELEAQRMAATRAVTLRHNRRTQADASSTGSIETPSPTANEGIITEPTSPEAKQTLPEVHVEPVSVPVKITPPLSVEVEPVRPSSPLPLQSETSRNEFIDNRRTQSEASSTGSIETPMPTQNEGKLPEPRKTLPDVYLAVKPASEPKKVEVAMPKVTEPEKPKLPTSVEVEPERTRSPMPPGWSPEAPKNPFIDNRRTQSECSSTGSIENPSPTSNSGIVHAVSPTLPEVEPVQEPKKVEVAMPTVTEPETQAEVGSSSSLDLPPQLTMVEEPRPSLPQVIEPVQDTFPSVETTPPLIEVPQEPIVETSQVPVEVPAAIEPDQTPQIVIDNQDFASEISTAHVNSDSSSDIHGSTETSSMQSDDSSLLELNPNSSEQLDFETPNVIELSSDEGSAASVVSEPEVQTRAAPVQVPEPIEANVAPMSSFKPVEIASVSTPKGSKEAEVVSQPPSFDSVLEPVLPGPSPTPEFGRSLVEVPTPNFETPLPEVEAGPPPVWDSRPQPEPVEQTTLPDQTIFQQKEPQIVMPTSHSAPHNDNSVVEDQEEAQLVPHPMQPSMVKSSEPDQQREVIEEPYEEVRPVDLSAAQEQRQIVSSPSWSDAGGLDQPWPQLKPIVPAPPQPVQLPPQEVKVEKKRRIIPFGVKRSPPKTRQVSRDDDEQFGNLAPRFTSRTTRPPPGFPGHVQHLQDREEAPPPPRAINEVQPSRSYADMARQPPPLPSYPMNLPYIDDTPPSYQLTDSSSLNSSNVVDVDDEPSNDTPVTQVWTPSDRAQTLRKITTTTTQTETRHTFQPRLGPLPTSTFVRPQEPPFYNPPIGGQVGQVPGMRFVQRPRGPPPFINQPRPVNRNSNFPGLRGHIPDEHHDLVTKFVRESRPVAEKQVHGTFNTDHLIDEEFRNKPLHPSISAALKLHPEHLIDRNNKPRSPSRRSRSASSRKSSKSSSRSRSKSPCTCGKNGTCKKCRNKSPSNK